jgi:hypothetical protein
VRSTWGRGHRWARGRTSSAGSGDRG